MYRLSQASFWIIILTCISVGQVLAQPLGGKTGFEMLNLPASPLLGGIGGMNVSTLTDDPAIQQASPALLSSQAHKRLSFNYMNQVTGINVVGISSAYALDSNTTFGAQLNYLGYGKMTETDVAGNVLGTFQAQDFSLGVVGSQQRGPFRLGAGLKFVNSQIASFSSMAFALDLGVLYHVKGSNFSAGLAAKNVGFPITRFSSSSNARLPLNVQLGASYKLAHMPLRFSVTAHTIQQWDIFYNDPNSRLYLDASGVPGPPSQNFLDQTFRHLVFGGEFLFSPNFNIRLGYNHLLARELGLEGARALNGWSGGFMMRIKSLEINYTHAFYHTGSAVAYLGVGTSLQRVLGWE